MGTLFERDIVSASFGSFFNEGPSFLNGQMTVSQFYLLSNCQIFGLLAMVLDFLARSEAIEAAALSPSTTDLVPPD
jgi:hypothetical protein